ncbi:MAG: Bax inhibitor-1/YccA family protein [Bacteroidetes bacterium]|nr:Bax inhibitor-1/YccA family protein [Bacteroidota bacterium]
MFNANPILNTKSFYTAPAYRKKTFSISGAINKSIILIVFTTLIASFTWYYGETIHFRFPKYWFTISGLLALLTAIIIRYKRHLAGVLSFVYALFKGVFLGAISSNYEMQFNGIVAQAVVLTLLVFFIMLLLYKFRIITVSKKLRAIVMASTTAIFTIYFISFMLYLFNLPPIPYIHGNGIIGIIFSVFVAVTASFHLLLDFSFFEKCRNYKFDINMEWYAALYMLVSVIWQYLSLLRLLRKVRN